MKYINVFDKDTDYVSFRDSTGYTKPNVSLSRDTKVVHYNYPIWDTNGKPFVDLGLPSGTLWATMNVGASKASDYGKYFQWGDISGYTADQVGTGDGKKQFTDSDYKWGKDPNYTKYTTTSAKLELDDDAAHVHMGGDWHMPSLNQIEELISNANTTSTWTSLNGINGMKIASKKDEDKFIFIPAAGAAWSGLVDNIRSDGYIWSSMLGDDANGAKYCIFSSLGTSISNFVRYNGISIRGVLG